MFPTWLANDVLASNLYPVHEAIMVFFPELTKWEEKFVRFQQYKYFMEKRTIKYDFLELGVLEKFPYPRLNAPEGKPGSA